MGTMKLIAHDGRELKNIEFPELSIEEINETLKDLKELKAHEKDQVPKFYDYVGCIGLIKQIPQSVAEQFEKVASKYGKKIEGIKYDKCCTG